MPNTNIFDTDLNSKVKLFEIGLLILKNIANLLVKKVIAKITLMIAIIINIKVSKTKLIFLLILTISI